MGNWRTVDDYIQNEKKKLTIALIVTGLGFLFIAVSFGVHCDQFSGFPFIIFALVPVAVVIFCFVILAVILNKKALSGKIWKVACPKCEKHIELNNWPCPCGSVSQRHIFEGCSNCGTKYGPLANNIRSVLCPFCGYELSFFEQYKFYNWSILAKGETTNEFVLVPRQNVFKVISFIAGGFLLLSIIDGLTSDPNKLSKFSVANKPYFLLALMVVTFVFALIGKTAIPPKKLVRNPKYKEGPHG